MSCLPTAVSALAAEPRCAGRAVSTPAVAWAIGLAAALWLPGPAGAASSVVTTPQVRAELIAHAPEGVGPGKPLWLGLKIEHQPHWHTYWKNPGDSGLPTALQWTLPAGVDVGEIDWPTPQRLPIGTLVNFGYEGPVLLPVPVQMPATLPQTSAIGAGATAPAGTLPVRLRADWLVCKEVCIPEGGDFALDLPIAAATAAHAALFEAARAAVPRRPEGARVDSRFDGDALVLRVHGLPADWRGRPLTPMPETPAVFVHAAPVTTAWDGPVWTARLTVDPMRMDSPPRVPVVLVAEGRPQGLRVEAATAEGWPAQAPVPALGAAASGAAGGAAGGAGAAPVAAPAGAGPVGLSAEGGGAASGLGLSLVLAFVGGLILNLMPCVFPVLSLKVLGFAHAGADRRAQLAGGLAYTAGVVASFVGLAGLLLALRAGGEQLGWGFQLQSPPFVAAMATLFTLIGLNLAGLFEVGTLLPGRWAAARARHPVADHALTGVLAVAVASPCTAPFMGASLGAALTLPPAQGLLVFVALGLGMAAPYLAASAWPALARALPRPGVWMQHLRQLLAFPMFATVLWLLWVLGLQLGLDAVVALLGLLLALALAAWALGSPALGRRARIGFGLPALALLAAAVLWAWPALRADALSPASAPAGERTGVAGGAGDAASPSAQGIDWQPWSAGRVSEALAAGRPVFVDFTAAWCVTCQVNKRGTLATDAVSAAFRERRVTALRADWTRRDPAISAELSRLGRSGVPVYLVWLPGQAQPRLLSELLSVREVLAAIDGPAAAR
ncbi:MAG: hypothetical protein RL223_893 [Pseudomonadota bacterium]